MMRGTCQGCGSRDRDIRPVKVGPQSVPLCDECIKEWGLDA